MSSGAPSAVDTQQTGQLFADHTVLSYYQAFRPGPEWDEVVLWPPDVFALTNLVLDHTEAFRFPVAPPSGLHWPPTQDWNELVAVAAREWRGVAGSATDQPPLFVREQWAVLEAGRNTPLASLREGTETALLSALLTLHAVADESCQSLALHDESMGPESFEQKAWRLLDERGSLSRISPSRICIVPKTHLSQRGITIRSISRYLALSYESVGVRWARVQPAQRPAQPGKMRGEYRLLLLPWPLTLSSEAFREVSGPLDNMDSRAFGFFEFDPKPAMDLERLALLLDEACSTEGVDAVVFPEAAVQDSEIPLIEELLEARGIGLLYAGARKAAADEEFGANYVHLGVRGLGGWERFDQSKHHRWCLDRGQLLQYHLTRSLDPRRQWWEAISLSQRTVQVIDIGDGATTVALVCEDLARLDEVADLLRRLGPTLVIALLLDGPQLAGRWSYRYASVLADDPGSAVLTLTSLGMVRRSTPHGRSRSRVVGMWNDPVSGLVEIELAKGASGVLIKCKTETRMVWTADGRMHLETPALQLNDVRSVSAPVSR